LVLLFEARKIGGRVHRTLNHKGDSERSRNSLSTVPRRAGQRKKGLEGAESARSGREEEAQVLGKEAEKIIGESKKQIPSEKGTDHPVRRFPKRS